MYKNELRIILLIYVYALFQTAFRTVIQSRSPHGGERVSDIQNKKNMYVYIYIYKTTYRPDRKWSAM